MHTTFFIAPPNPPRAAHPIAVPAPTPQRAHPQEVIAIAALSAALTVSIPIMLSVLACCAYLTLGAA